MLVDDEDSGLALTPRLWKDVFAAAEGVGGVKYYLLTHGATELTPLETVKRDLEQYKAIHG